MNQQSLWFCLALVALSGCSVEVKAGVDDSGSGGQSGGATSGGAGGASGGAGGTMAESGGSGGTTGGTGGTMASGGMGGGPAELDASTDPDGAQPDYGDLIIRPDTSTTPVGSCTGQPVMTLCSVITAPDRAYDICVDEACVSPGCGDQTCNAPGPHFRIPPLFHHPALELQPGQEPVTIDLITGLHWQACASGQTGPDCAGGMAEMFSWSDAIAYCDELSWNGHDDWYLPDPYELISIIDVDQPDESTILTSDAAFPNAASASVYWTSATTGPTNEALAITSHRDSGEIATRQAKATVIFARCVRRGFSGAMSPVQARYEKAATTFTDRATGLVWPSCLARIPDATTCDDLMDKAGANNLTERCAQLDWGGSTAWRMPTFKELHSLVLYQTDASLGESLLDESVVTPSGPFLLTEDGNLFAVDGRRAVLPIAGTYPYLCVRGPIMFSEQG